MDLSACRSWGRRWFVTTHIPGGIDPGPQAPTGIPEAGAYAASMAAIAAAGDAGLHPPYRESGSGQAGPYGELWGILTVLLLGLFFLGMLLLTGIVR